MVSEIRKKLSEIEGVTITNFSFHFNNYNRIILEIKNKEDYIKWQYFIKRAREDCSEIKIIKKLPTIEFRFPKRSDDLDNALTKFNEILDRKYYLIPEPENDSTTIICKVTNNCNIDCQYCYDKPFRRKLGHNGVLNFEYLEKLIDMCSKYSKEVELIWHGGEPTLAGIDYMKRVYDEVIPKFPYLDFHSCIQTNGTLLNEDWIDFVIEYGISIGSSYQATNEDLRHTEADNKLGSKTHDIYSVMDNLKKAVKYGQTKKENYSIGVIDVLTKQNHPNIIEMYEYYKDQGIDAAFNAIHHAGEAEKHDFLFWTPEAMEDYRKKTMEYFYYWLTDTDERCFYDRYAGEYMQMILANEVTVCKNGNECMYNWICINSNGDLYPCDRAMPSDYRIGHVNEINSLKEAYEKRNYKKFVSQRKEKFKTYCNKCRYYEFCHGSCPMEDMDMHGAVNKPNTYTCKMLRVDLACAYKTLCKVTFDECNSHMKDYLLTRTLLLPNEVPVFLDYIGARDLFDALNYNPEIAKPYDYSFNVFKALNIRGGNMVRGHVNHYNTVGSTIDIDTGLDIRFESLKKILLNRAEEIAETLAAGKEEES